MLSSVYFRQTSRHVGLISSRVNLSTLPYPKSSETQAAPDGTPVNYPTTQKQVELQEIERIEQSTPETKVSNTFVLSGVPLRSTSPPLAHESSSSTKKEEHKRIPSSRFSAFLRSIRSGLPFFPSKKALASPVNVVSKREHFLPVQLSLLPYPNTPILFI